MAESTEGVKVRQAESCQLFIMNRLGWIRLEHGELTYGNTVHSR
eukprot:COSAG02_NODE_349_length_24073_cov_102.816092_28_plen_44_part_00